MTELYHRHVWRIVLPAVSENEALAFCECGKLLSRVDVEKILNGEMPLEVDYLRVNT